MSTFLKLREGATWEQSIPGTGNSQCRGSEVTGTRSEGLKILEGRGWATRGTGAVQGHYLLYLTIGLLWLPGWAQCEVGTWQKQEVAPSSPFSSQHPHPSSSNAPEGG